MTTFSTRIYIHDWLELKPYERQAPTDTYYLRLSNEIKKLILKGSDVSTWPHYLENAELDLLSCFLASYFEDLISGTRIWPTFVRLHHKIYGEYIPFFKYEEYYEDEINLADIEFLIWYYLNTFQDDDFIPPAYGFIGSAASKIYALLDSAWESAPENTTLQKFYQLDENTTDFYKARKFVDTILFSTYLFHTDTFLNLRENEIDILEKYRNDKAVLTYLNDTRDNLVHNSYTRLLSLTGKEWAAEILGENHPLYLAFKKISPKITGFFLYKGQDAEIIQLEHIASGKKFKLTKKSFDHQDDLQETDTIVFIGLINWKDEWWFSGTYLKQHFNADFVLDEKNNIQSRNAVSFLDYEKRDMNQLLQLQLNAFLDFNQGSQIAFLAANKIPAFLKEYVNHYDKSLNVSNDERKKSKQRALDEGFFGTDDAFQELNTIDDNGLIFFNPQRGPEIAFGVNSAFPAKNNPYFDSNQSTEAIMTLFCEEESSKELVHYCLAHFQQDLPFFKTNVGLLFLENTDFLLRFLKPKMYHTTPSISFIGIDNS